MRTENSLKNAIWSMITFGVGLLVSFVARKVFISILGAEYNGLNSLLTSIISILSIAELGIGTTIVYALYRPLHDKDAGLVCSLMNYYKKCYRVIAGVVLIVGVAIIPFLPTIVGSINLDINVYLVYLLFLAEAVLSYLLSYRRSLLIADQKERVIKYIHLASIVLMNAVQIALLFLTKDYYLFLVIRIIFTCAENIIISMVVNKKYSYILEKAYPLPRAIKNALNRKIRAMFYHQIGGFVVNGSDNIMISMIFGVTEVGYYNNYFMIVSSLHSLVSNVFSSITASIGNLLVSKNCRDSMNAYRGILGINYILAAFISCSFYVCAQPFMQIWLGSEYVMSNLVVGSLAVYLYFRMMKLTTGAFKNAAGIFYEDRFVPIVESIVNIAASLICAHLFGISGIIMGTVISNFVLYFGSYPFIAYRKVFKTSAKLYFQQHISYLVLTIAVDALIILATAVIKTGNPVIELIKNFVVTVVVYAGVFMFLKMSNSSFDAIMKRVIMKISKRKK